jgi:uncharacterized protein
MKPFIYKFETDDNKYIYDTLTNEILKVDGAVFDVIDYIYECEEDEILNRFQRRYARDRLARALHEIREARQKGFFSRMGEAGISFFPRSFVSDAIRNNLAHLVLNITESCNLRCRYCVYSGRYPLERTHSQRCMEESVARRAIDYFLEHGNPGKPRIVGFYGGEPLLRFDLIRACVEYVKARTDKGVFSITTNGILLNKEIIRYLISENIGLAVSLDPPRENHDRYRIAADGSATYDRILSNLSLIKSEDQRYYENSVVISTVLKSIQDLQDVRSAVNGTKEIGEHTILLNYLIPFNNELVEDGVVTKFDLDKGSYIREFAGMLRFGRMDRFFSFLLNQEYSKIHFRTRFKGDSRNVLFNQLCIPGATKLIVNTDGEFHFCTNLCSHMSIGDVRSGIDEAKVHSLIEAYLEMSRNECSHCWAVRLCDACYIVAARGDEFSRSQKERVCPNIRKETEALLWAYSSVLEQNDNGFDFLKNPKPGSV